MGSGGFRRLFRKESTTEDEIKQLVDEDKGELEKSTRDIIHNVFEFDDTTAGDIMTHRTDIAAVSSDDAITDVVKVAIDDGVSRIPVYCEDLDNIKGIVCIKDLLKFIGEEIPKNEKLEDYIREPLFVPETIPCGKLFKQMTDTRIQLAIVVDEYGGTAGLVTMEDIIEELVGEIYDENDEVSHDIVKISDNVYEVSGFLSISDMLEGMGLDDDMIESTYTSVGGWITEILQHIPEKGETAQSGIFNVTVLDVKEQTVKKVRIKICSDKTNN